MVWGINFLLKPWRQRMPILKRVKTKYPGVYFVDSTSVSGKKEKIYYIRYRKKGKMIEEKAGRQFQDDMTPARAAGKRADRIEGKQSTNKETRQAEEAAKREKAAKWTIDRLWEEYKNLRVDTKGLRVDQNRYENHLKTKFEKNEPKELIQLDIDRLRIRLMKKKSPQTVKHVLALLQRIINFGVKKQLCQGLGFKIEMPKVNNLKTEDLTPEQLDSLLKEIGKSENIHAANMMKMALFTGVRRGEMFKLKWKHINFERGFITLVDPKGGPDQKIPMNDAARDLLNSHPKSDSPYVFPGRGGRKRTDIKHQVNKIKEDAGIPKDFRALHGLRHVYASMLASSGEVDMYTLQKLLTHKHPLMTQRYAHLRDVALKRAAAVAGSIIEGVIKQKANGKVVNLEDHK